MKAIGLIGGMSWESSLEYYRLINELVQEKLGGLHSARCILYSVDFAEVEAHLQQGNWDELTNVLIDCAQKLERAGADVIVICTNTMHKMADEIQAALTIPLLHIVDATADKILEHGLRSVGLLGTQMTMEEDFYKKRLQERYDIEVLIPADSERRTIHRVIFDELCRGMLKGDSKERFRAIIENLVKNGAEGVILGCTEIPLLIEQEDIAVPLFDTTTIHAHAAVEYALR